MRPGGFFFNFFRCHCLKVLSLEPFGFPGKKFFGFFSLMPEHEFRRLEFGVRKGLPTIHVMYFVHVLY